MLTTKFNGDTISIWHKVCEPKIVETLRTDIARLVDIGNESGVKMDGGMNFKEVLNAPKQPSFSNNRGSRGGRGRGRGSRGGHS